MLDTPVKSLAWEQSPLQATASMPGVGAVVTDACVWEKKRPDTRELIKKPTKATGTEEIFSAVAFMKVQGNGNLPLRRWSGRGAIATARREPNWGITTRDNGETRGNA